MCARAIAKAWHGSNTEKSKAKGLAWYAANKAQSAANNKAWAKANPEKTKAYRNTPTAQAARRAWQCANPEKLAAATRAWKAANAQEQRIYQSNHRAQQVGAPGKLSSGLVARLFALQQGLCPCCHQPLGLDFQVDHIMALSQGGSNEGENIQLLTSSCNRAKQVSHSVDYMQSRGFLL